MAKTVQIKDAAKHVYITSPNPTDVRIPVFTDSEPFGYIDAPVLRTNIQRDLDANTCTRVGMIVTVGTCGTNFPTEDSNGGVLIVLGHSADHLVQIFTKSGLTVPALFVRRRSMGVWGDWYMTAMQPVSVA